MDDKVLRRTIIDVLDHEPSIDAARIGVAVENGIATLTGRVSNQAEKAAAERTVRRVRGVRAVVLALEICESARQSGRTAPDDEIARRARIVIAWHLHLEGNVITVQVHNGWVTLTGTVEDAYERQEAEAAVRRLDDVVGITNLIETRVSATPDQVEVTLGCSKSSAGAIYLPGADDRTASGGTNAQAASSLVERAAGWLRTRCGGGEPSRPVSRL